MNPTPFITRNRPNIHPRLQAGFNPSRLPHIESRNGRQREAGLTATSRGLQLGKGHVPLCQSPSMTGSTFVIARLRTRNLALPCFICFMALACSCHYSGWSGFGVWCSGNGDFMLRRQHDEDPVNRRVPLRKRVGI